MVILAAAGAIALSLSNWRRYSANPTVVSLRKDFRNWNNVFPSATACFLERTNKEFANKYVFEYVFSVNGKVKSNSILDYSKWGSTENDEKYHYYMDFVKTVANVSFETLDLFKKFENDETLNNIDMVELIAKVKAMIIHKNMPKSIL